MSEIRLDKENFGITKNAVFSLAIIAIIAIVLRLIYFPTEVPFRLDVVDYFGYAIKMNQVGHFPTNWPLANNGWSSFISFFYMFIPNNFFDAVHLQRLLSVSISIITIIPVYFLSRKFFNEKISLIGAAIFVFEPRIVLNSLQGDTMPLYILLIAVLFCLFLTKNNKIMYSSFVLLALASTVRYEALVLFLPMTIMFFIKRKNVNKKIFRYFFCLFLFLLIIIPIAYLRIDASGSDGLLSHFFAVISFIEYEVLQGLTPISTDPDYRPIDIRTPNEIWITENQDNSTVFVSQISTNFLKMFGLTLIPIFILFMPAGVFLLISKKKYKEINHKILSIILFTFFLILPAFYAYGRNFEDPRYLFIIFPVYVITSLFFINTVYKKLDERKWVLCAIIIVLIIVFFGAFSFKDIDSSNNHDKEAFQITEFVVENCNGINYFYPESQFVKSATISSNWPNIPEPDRWGHGHITSEIQLIEADGYSSLNKFIIDKKDLGLTHLFIDGKFGRNSIFNDVHFNEQNYPFLKKIFDSQDNGFDYHVKIFEIKYDLIEKMYDK
jgi:hypothetical protein